MSTHTGLLRFITAGSVDDGKSTLIGRLLYDSKSILADQLSAIEKTSERRGLTQVDLSLLTDGLEAEREQGITIDVAYRYFATPKRKFIIGDAPGHEQYTRNMVTAASTADVGIILIDARRGVLPQTRRHSYLARLVGIPRVVLAINKMDLVDYSKEVFETIRTDYLSFAENLGFTEILPIPMSALEGDNVVEPGDRMPWYSGPTLVDYLDAVPALHDRSDHPFRFPVQRVTRVMLGNQADVVIGLPTEGEFRGYQGGVAAGTVRIGDAVRVLPIGKTSTVKSILTADGPVEEAQGDTAIVLELADEIDISRGDMLVAASAEPTVTQDVEATLCWLSEEALAPQRKYWVKHTTRTVRASFKDLLYRVDVNTLERISGVDTLQMNDIARVKLRLQQPIFVDSYTENRITGSFIVIDDATNNTVGAGVILPE